MAGSREEPAESAERPSRPSQTSTGAQAAGVVWDLGPLEARGPFAARVQALRQASQGFAERWRGRMATITAPALAAALAESAELIAEMGRLYTYAGLREAADVQDDEARDLKAQAEQAGLGFDNTLRFFELEWLALDDERAEALLAAPELVASAHHLRSRRRLRPYRLSEAEESALATRAPAAEAAWVQLYSEQLARTAVAFDAGSGQRPYTLAELRSLGRHPDRRLRQAALDAHYQALGPLQPVLSRCYDSLVTDRLATDHLRGVADPMLPTHLDNELAPDVVSEMLDEVVAGYRLAQRWYRAKAGLLGLERVEYYDVNAPLGEPARLGYRQAAALLDAALRELDPQLATAAAQLEAERHVDAEVRPGKMPGAFCAALPTDLGPYLLLSYNDLTEDGLTLAHETGHALHYLLAYAAQPAYQAEAGTAVAEIASTFVETLMFEQVLAAAPAAGRLELLAAQLERILGTVFIQVVMTRFEVAAYQARGTGQALTAERLDQIWLSELEAYLGDAVTLPPAYGRGWSYVPHFAFARFYTYAYTFALLVALALVERRHEPGFAERYRAFLAAGASVSPSELLERLGVELGPELWRSGLRRIERWIDEAEALAQAQAASAER